MHIIHGENMKIIVFSDSLGRPRPDMPIHESTEYEDVYGYLLKEYYKPHHDVEIIYVDSLDTDDAIYWSQRMVAFRRPDLVIFHIGLNDCVPRLFRKNSNSIILNSFFRKITFDFFFKLLRYFRYKITSMRKITYVSAQKFRANLMNIKKEIQLYNPKCEFIAISIAKSKILDRRSFGYNKNIEKYNLIINDVFLNFIEINHLLDENDFISDGIHLTKQAHLKLFNILKDFIGKFE